MGYLIAGYSLCSIPTLLLVYKVESCVTLLDILLSLISGPIGLCIWILIYGEKIVVFGKGE